MAAKVVGAMTFDLGAYNFDLGDTPPVPDKLQDTSGKPCPTSAFLVTADGYRLQADIVYDGIDEQTGDRRYALVVESDWLSLRLTACELDRHPGDVQIMFKMPGDFDPEHRAQLAAVLRSIAWVVGSTTIPGQQVIPHWRKTDG